jgi:hypothetical protein
MESSAPETAPGGSLRLGRGQLCACIGAGTAAFAIWLWPIALGLVAIALGIAAMVRGEPRGRWVIDGRGLRPDRPRSPRPAKVIGS